jgi:hypothetical protein
MLATKGAFAVAKHGRDHLYHAGTAGAKNGYGRLPYHVAVHSPVLGLQAQFC